MLVVGVTVTVGVTVSVGVTVTIGVAVAVGVTVTVLVAAGKYCLGTTRLRTGPRQELTGRGWQRDGGCSGAEARTRAAVCGGAAAGAGIARDGAGGG